MGLETQESTASSVTTTEKPAETSVAADKPTETTAQPADSAGSGSVPAGAAAPAAAATPYTPNFKFKVKDKEMEFDDFLRGAIKETAHEKKIRELYERAHGLDEVKASRANFETKFKDAETRYQQVEQGLGQIGKLVKEGRMADFFQALNIPKEKIIQYAIEELKYQELPPEQRQQIDHQRRLQQEFDQTAQQNQSMQQQLQGLVQAQARTELMSELGKPDVSQVVAAFDTRHGKPGAFEAEVIRRGQYYEAVHKISPPASQLVQEVLSLMGPPQAAQSQTAQVVAAQAEKPVIPAFASGSQKSPVQKVPGSIEDLRKLRQQRAET